MTSLIRLLVLLVLVERSVGPHIIRSRTFEHSINSTLECLRCKLNQGFPKLELPHFNPFIMHDMTLNFTALGVENLKGVVKFKHTMITGLTKWETSDVTGTISPIPLTYTMKLTVLFPQIILDTKYTGCLKIDNGTTLSGKGAFNFNVKNVRLNISLKFTIIGETKLRNFHVLPSIGKINSFELTGLAMNKKRCKNPSQYIMKHGKELVAKRAEKIDAFVGKVVVEVANKDQECGPLKRLLNKCANNTVCK